MKYPKHKTIKDLKLRKKIKEDANGHCEFCGVFSRCLETAHVIAKGMGGCNGPDIRENLLALCGPAAMGAGCHGAEHRGRISEAELFEIVARREKKTAEECRVIVRQAMGYDVEVRDEEVVCFAQ